MAFSPHKFGRYIIVDPIAVGGMAEIYRARLSAAKEGPDRVIVIKKVIANLSQNSEFIQMFEEEIKITVGLTHPNIIQIYDYGKVDDQYFMAMEYVEGKNLRQFVKRLADMKSMFSIDMSCYIISQVCHALAYAHAFKDRMSGKSLGIVHRDISPQNVMISYDGAVKLFDFGIAKAKSASEATRAGVIKGKPSYLSPEQINGEELDGRCDVFALGIVLWELLTTKRLFVAETDMGVLRLIQSSKIEPPSTYNPAVPQSLDAIALKSLSRDKNKRYQNAEEFQRDLHKFLYSFNPSFNPADLSYYAQELFKKEIHEDRDRLQKALAIQPVDNGSSDEGSGDKQSNTASKNKLSNKLAEGLISTTDFNREMMDMVVQQQTGSINQPSSLELISSPDMSKPKTANVPPVPGGKPPLPPGKKAPADKGSGLIMQGATKTRASVSSMPQAKKTAPNESMVIPPWSKGGGGSSGASGNSRSGTSVSGRGSGSKTITNLRREVSSLHDEPNNNGRNAALAVVVFLVGIIFTARQFGLLCGTPLEALGSGCGRGPANVIPVPNPNSPIEAPIVQQTTAPQPSPVAQAIVKIETDLQNYDVKVNGRPAVVFNGQFNVPLKESLKIEVSKKGYRTHIAEFAPLESPATQKLNVKLEKVPMGTVQFSTVPEAVASFYLGEEKKFEGPTPVREDLPAGKYRVRLDNNLLGFHQEFEFEVHEGKVNKVEKVLDVKH